MEEITQKNYTSRLCPTHSKQNIEFSSNSSPKEVLKEKAFYCTLCLIQKEIKTTSLLSIEEILTTRSNKPITNWPPGIQKWQTEYLAKRDSVRKKDKIKMQLQDFYFELESKILRSLRLSQQKQFALLEECDALESDLIEFYNERFKRIELQNLFLNYNFRETDYLKLIHSVEQGRTQNLRELTNRIKAIESIENQFKYNRQLHKIQSIFEETIAKIGFFSSDLNTIDSNYDLQKQTKQHEELEDASYYKNILEDIFHTSRQQQIMSSERSFQVSKSIVKDCLNTVQDKEDSQSKTEDLQQLLKLMDNIHSNLTQFEIKLEDPNRSKLEHQVENEKNISNHRAKKTIVMYKESTQNQKEIPQQDFLGELSFSTKQNNIFRDFNQIEKTIPKPLQNGKPLGYVSTNSYSQILNDKPIQEIFLDKLNSSKLISNGKDFLFNSVKSIYGSIFDSVSQYNPSNPKTKPNKLRSLGESFAKRESVGGQYGNRQDNCSTKSNEGQLLVISQYRTIDRGLLVSEQQQILDNIPKGEFSASKADLFREERLFKDRQYYSQTKLNGGGLIGVPENRTMNGGLLSSQQYSSYITPKEEIISSGSTIEAQKKGLYEFEQQVVPNQISQGGDIFSELSADATEKSVLNYNQKAIPSQTNESIFSLPPIFEETEKSRDGSEANNSQNTNEEITNFDSIGFIEKDSNENKIPLQIDSNTEIVDIFSLDQSQQKLNNQQS